MAVEWPTQLAGEAVHLLGERALWWPAQRALMIADLHLGKADIFRRAGIALPAGGTSSDLQRLQALVATTGCQALWILGDVLHGPVHRAAWYRQWLGWREQHPELAIHVVAGNHDRALPHAALEVQVHEAPVQLGPFLLCHEPRQVPGACVLSGHLHPQVALPGMARRWPIFWLRTGSCVLPAFSRFTAGVVVPPARGEQRVACVEGSVVVLPSR